MAQSSETQPARQPRKAAGFPVVALLMLLVAGFIGYRAATYDANVVRCGADVMRPGDRCLSTGNGGGTYDAVQAFQARNHRIDVYVAIGSGSVAGVLLATWLVRGIMERSRMEGSLPPD